jgi:hypothetical protein
MVKTSPSFEVSRIFTSKLLLAPISLLKTIASNIFIFLSPSPNYAAHYSKNIWTGECKLGLLLNNMGLTTLKASCLIGQKALSAFSTMRLNGKREEIIG